MIKVQRSFLDKLSGEAKEDPRLRKNYNFHKDNSDVLQRMLNALEPSTYVRPHKHVNPDKREAFILLKGKIAIIEFDESGNISDSILLDHKLGNYAAEIIPASWHTVISLVSDSVYYELKDGPYKAATDKILADWAPVDGSHEALAYLENLKKQIFSV